MHARVPGLPILFVTGYFDTHDAGFRGLDGEEALLLKPFTPMQLRERVEQLLTRTVELGADTQLRLRAAR